MGLLPTHTKTSKQALKADVRSQAQTKSTNVEACFVVEKKHRDPSPKMPLVGRVAIFINWGFFCGSTRANDFWTLPCSNQVLWSWKRPFEGSMSIELTRNVDYWRPEVPIIYTSHI